jgi:iron complex outermembrane receptor protein
MSSGVYAGHVESYVLIDLLAGAEVPWVVGLRATLAAENVLDDRHREFVGAPELGRLVTGRLHYTF